MRKFGVKLWSMDFVSNPQFVLEAEKALKEGKFGYLELFALPDTYDEVKEEAKRFEGLLTVIHAPHVRQDFDTSNPDRVVENQKIFADSKKFADLLDAKMIVTHPGDRYGEGSLEENIRQFKALNDERIAVENLPYTCSSTHRDLMGATVEEIKSIKDEVHCRFCLDFSHAICSANKLKLNIYDMLAAFKALKPDMYHLCDGDDKSTIDAHLHYGEGNYDLRRFLTEFTDENALITMETGKGLPTGIKPWLDDAAYLSKLL
jgi:sugar phosphate isomerase/epimerase